MKFQYPWFLLVAVMVPLMGFYWSFLRLKRERTLKKISLKVASSQFSGLQMFLVVAGLVLAAIAAARPQWGKVESLTLLNSRNVAVVIDVSRSMLTADVRPNRLERVKADVADLIDSLEGDRCALVAFRRTGVCICPLTTDRAFLRSSLESLTPDSAPRGETSLGSALTAALAALDPVADDHNAIILLSDGGDLRGEALAAAAIAKKRGIPIFTVGIGNPERASTVPDDNGRAMMFEGKKVESKLEEAALKAIAASSAGGQYVPLATAGTAETTLGAIYRRFLRKVAAKEQNESEQLVAERYQVFLMPAIGCLLLGAMLSRGRFAKERSCCREQNQV